MHRTVVVVVLAGLAVLAAGCKRPPRDMTGDPVLVAGSYAKTCRNVVSTPDGTLTADCLDTHGQFHRTTVAAPTCAGDISNMNGVLTCPTVSKKQG